MKKEWYKSKILWLNVALFLVATVQDLSSVMVISDRTMLYLGAISNFLLRLKTYQGLFMPEGQETIDNNL